LYSGLVNHPLFHPTGWEDIENSLLEIRNNTNYYVFLDRMSCSESNYPIYGGGNTVNRDYEFGRAPDKAMMKWNGYYQCKPPEDLNLENSRLFQAANSTANNHLNITVKLVIFDCAGWGDCHGKKPPDIPVSIAFLSGMLPQIDEDIDQGLIPPLGKRTILTTKEEESIRSCQAETEREFNVVYMGNFRSGTNSEFHKKFGGARSSYEDYHNESKKIFIQDKHKRKPVGRDGKELSFTDVLRHTKFALTPRGDNKFSYRFSEVLSAGAIPVYHGDNYVLPFRPELFDWNKCAILLPEKDAGEVAMDYIENKLLQDPETMCSMRKYCYFEIYKKYIETGEKIIDGLVKGLDLTARGHTAKFQGYRCNHTEDLGCNNLR